MDANGYLILSDFGLAKKIDGLAHSFCGTPEYLAPEMIAGTGHNKMVDWWAIGILLYEMIVGIPPFYSKNKNKMYDLIQNQNIRYPDPAKHGIEVGPEAQDLIN